MPAEQTRNNKKSRNDGNRDRGGRKERAEKAGNTYQSRQNPNQHYDGERTNTSDHSQPMGEFSDWNKQGS